jgi:hypothetical protein
VVSLPSSLRRAAAPTSSRRCPDLAPTLHRRASECYAQEGWIDQAVTRALAARDHERAAGLVQQHGGDAFARGEFGLVLGWLEALPEELVRSRPLMGTSFASIIHLSNTKIVQPDDVRGRKQWYTRSDARRWDLTPIIPDGA